MSQTARPAPPGPRATGILLTLVTAFWGLKPLVSGAPARTWLLGLSTFLAVLTLVFPRILQPVSAAMHRAGMMGTRVLGVISLGVAFYVVLTPVAVLMRLSGRNPLRLGKDAAARSYWVEVTADEAAPSDLSRQY